jgi:hypothetical protein
MSGNLENRLLSQEKNSERWHTLQRLRVKTLGQEIFSPSKYREWSVCAISGRKVLTQQSKRETNLY